MLTSVYVLGLSASEPHFVNNKKNFFFFNVKLLFIQQVVLTGWN